MTVFLLLRDDCYHERCESAGSLRIQLRVVVHEYLLEGVVARKTDRLAMKRRPFSRVLPTFADHASGPALVSLDDRRRYRLPRVQPAVPMIRLVKRFDHKLSRGGRPIEVSVTRGGAGIVTATPTSDEPYPADPYLLQGLSDTTVVPHAFSQHNNHQRH